MQGRTHRWIWTILFTWLPLAAAAESGKDLLIIVHPNAPILSVGFDKLKACFLKKHTVSIGPISLVPVNASAGSELRKAFQQNVLLMDPDEETKYWQDQKIKKGLEPPAETTTPLRLIRGYQKAIGYVFREQWKEGQARIVATVPAK